MPRYPALTSGEKQVLRLMEAHISWTRQEVADRLGLGKTAVTNRMTSIKNKMGTSNIVEILRRARDQL